MITPNWIKQIKTPKVRASDRIPIYAPLILDQERTYVNECLTDTWLSSKGQFVTKFEHAFASYCHVPYAVACSSGTAALFLTLKLLQIKKGDEVIIPSYTMISTAFAVTYTGARPVFVDCLPDSGNIDPGQIEKNITPRTKIIIPVHVYGNPCDMNRIQQVAGKYNISVFEDAAEALGSTYRGKKIGSISNYSAFSLYVNKIVTTGEGGMITLTSASLYRKLKRLNNYYFSSKRHFWHEHIGYNMRMSNIQAAIGLGQIQHIEDTLTRKRVIAGWYAKLLRPLRERLAPLPINPDGESNYWHIAYRKTGRTVDIMKLRNYLGENGIETRGFFIPLHLQPPYRRPEYAGKFPNAESLAQAGMLFPSGPTLSRSQVERICTEIIKFFHR